MQVGIGVIGLGWMGRVHASSYRRVPEHFPDLGVTPRLVVAADVSEARRSAAVGFERTVADWREVLDDPAVDAVSITLPNALHREVAVAAAQAGKHVWVEKPVGLGLADTEAVALAVREAGVLSAVGFCYRFAPGRPACAFVDRGGGDRDRHPLPRDVPRRLRAATRGPPPRGASVAPTRARARSAT